MIQPHSGHARPEQLLDNVLLQGISHELLDALSAQIPLVRLAPGELLFAEGDPGDSVYLVCEGVIRISKLGRAGKQETLHDMGPNDFFGEMAILDGQPRSAQALCEQAAVLGRIDRMAFECILAMAPHCVQMNFLRAVVGRLREGNEHFIAELVRTERLSLVGTMANSIIHDLKNPICVIRSCAEMIDTKSREPAVANLTQLMQRAVDNMLDMTQELLDFARGQNSLQFKEIPISRLVEELEDQVRLLIPENITLSGATDCQATVFVDVGRFARMLLNLIKNAVEAMSSGGSLSFSIKMRGPLVIFRVSDTGCGIAPELQARIFEPFVSYGKSKGTGLGMAIVKSVVEAHGGTISLHSEPGVGTDIEVAIKRLSE